MVVALALPPPIIAHFGAAAACVPAWADTINEAKKARVAKKVGKLRVPGCTYDDATEIVDCDPETMRAYVEAKLHDLGLCPRGTPLSFEVYAIARNIQSEASSGSAAEKVAIGESVYARSSYEGWSLNRILLKNGSRFARQKSTNPPVSTRQDPYWEDIVAASLVASGATGGYSRGATHYWSPAVIDYLHKQGKHADTRWTLYERWTKDYGFAWIGPLAGVNHNQQFLMVADLKDKDPDAWKAAYDAGKAALSKTGIPDVARLPVCGKEPRISMLVPAVLGLAGLGLLGYLVGKEMA